MVNGIPCIGPVVVKTKLKTCTYVNIRKRLLFTECNYYGQENSERYVTRMVGALPFVTKRYIW